MHANAWTHLEGMQEDIIIQITGIISTVGVLEKPLEKKAGRNFAPPGNKKLIYFVDDLNMPEVDAYGTVQPHTLIRQHLDYSHWYEKCASKHVEETFTVFKCAFD